MTAVEAIEHTRCPDCGEPTEDHGSTGHYCPGCNLMHRNGYRPTPELLGDRVLIGERLVGDVAPPDELITWILLVAKIHKIFSGPGDGKTFLALWIVRELVRLGKKIIYFDGENGPAIITERLDDLGADPLELDEHFYCIAAPDLTLESEAHRKYLALLDYIRPDLVVFDSWVDFLTLGGLDENSATEVTKWVHAFAALAKERGAAVLLLDHVPNDANRSRGFTQKLAKVDVSWRLKKVLDFDHHTVGQLELRLEKDREGWLPKRARFAVGGGEDGFVFRREAEVFEQPGSAVALTESQQRVLEYIDKHSTQGARWTEIKSHTGVSKSTLYYALKKLTESNLVTNVENRYYPADRTEPSFSHY